MRARLVVASALALVACGGRMLFLTGEVRSTQGPTLPGAYVSLECPPDESARSELGISDDAGRISVQDRARGRAVYDVCELVVEKPGYLTARQPIADLCQEYDGEHCSKLILAAQLRPEDQVIPVGQGIEIGVIVTVSGAPHHRETITAQVGKPATITARHAGRQYQLVIVPSFDGASAIRLDGEWSVSGGKTGVVNESMVAGTPRIITFLGSEVMMHVTVRRARNNTD